MATITYYLKETAAFPDKDMKVLASKFKGKVHKIELGEGDVNGAAVNSQKVVQEKIYKQVIQNLGLSTSGVKLLQSDGDFDGKVTQADDYDFFINVNGMRHKATLEVIFPKVKEEKKLEFTFANAKLKGMADKNVMTKIESVAASGPTETGHGPVEYLNGALHTHVTNTIGIAWEWHGGIMNVVAIGKKNNQNKFQQRGGKGKSLKTCEYDWTEK